VSLLTALHYRLKRAEQQRASHWWQSTKACISIKVTENDVKHFYEENSTNGAEKLVKQETNFENR